MEKVMARGPNFVFTKEFIILEYGNETWEKLLGILSPDAAGIWSQPPLAYNSYPFTAFKEMISALAKELKIVKDSETARLYEYIADRSLNRIYKMFFRLANPSFVIKNYPKLWERFFDSGKVEVPLSEKGHAMVKFILPEIFLDWLPPACLGYSKKAVEISGGENLTMSLKNRNHLTDELWEITYELRWDE
ncbi:MAG: hypothetical protein AB1632_05635 [Nitrospirota bacterium]